MSYCKNCNQKIVWSKDGEYWIPLDDDVKSHHYGSDHRKFCIKDPVYMKKRQVVLSIKPKDLPLQIDENTFI